MIFYILILLFTILLIWIIFAPIMITVDTAINRYRITLPGVLSVSVIPNSELFYIRAWLFFIPIRIDPFKSRKKRRFEKKKQDNKEKKKTKRQINIKSLLKRISNAFHIKKLKANLDTDDFMLNAWLIPVFSTINNQRNIELQVNFEGKLYFNLDLRTRISAIIWLLIKIKK